MMSLIETERLLLRSFEPEDWRKVFLYMSDPEVIRYLPEEPYAKEDSERFVLTTLERQGERGEWPEMLAVVLKAEDRLIGHMPFPVFSEKYRTREIGWIYDPRYQGQGYATEAALALLRWGFESLGLHRIIATCDPRNRASSRIMEKLGMRREAHFIKDVRLHGEWCDEYFYAILEEEWAARHSTQKGES